MNKATTLDDSRTAAPGHPWRDPARSVTVTAQVNAMQGRSRDNVTIHARLTDSTFRGAIALPDGRTGLVFDGGQIMAVSNPWVLSDFESQRILESAQRALSSEVATLAAIGNTSGSSKERSHTAFADASGVPDFGRTLAEEGRLDSRTIELRNRRTIALESQIEDI